jgi:rhodanese-related sulfurtransferase
MGDHMSTIAAKKLAELGYTNIWNLEGGMVAWRKQGYLLIQRQTK